MRQKILEIYAKTGQRLGCRKIGFCLARDFCTSISEGRVYQLMKEMNLSKMSTVKPPRPPKQSDDSQAFQNLLAQKFDQPAPIWSGSATLPMFGLAKGSVISALF
ncbi:IS3 family transposase [Anaerotruncus colihominis]